MKVTRKRKKSALEKDMDKLLLKMEEEADTGDWESYDDHLTLLDGMKSVDEHLKGKVRKDARNQSEMWKTALVIAGGLVEIVLIMNYEKLDNFATKAFGRVIRPKI